jgi:hypothetical protein
LNGLSAYPEVQLLLLVNVDEYFQKLGPPIQLICYPFSNMTSDRATIFEFGSPVKQDFAAISIFSQAETSLPRIESAFILVTSARQPREKISANSAALSLP